MKTLELEFDEKDERLARIGAALGFYDASELEAARLAAGQLAALGLRHRSLLSILGERGLLSPRAERIVRDHYRAKYPERIGDFEVYERIGQGGMGTVHRARHVRLDRIVALKLLASKFKAMPSFVERFLREAHAVGRLNHPNIVTGYDAGQDRGVYYVAMEYVAGESLRESIRRRGRLTEPEVVDVGIQIARALGHAARHGIVHRDVKPHNILITGEGAAKLCDLGLVKSGKKTELTSPGMGLGTVDYAAPEQLADAAACDVRSDLYSLGATLFQALTGRVPHPGLESASAAQAKRTAPVPDPADLVPDVSPALRQALRKCLDPDPERRPRNASAFEAELQAVLGEKTTPGPVRRTIADRAKRLRLRRRRTGNWAQ